jgi:hypothetical protein
MAVTRTNVDFAKRILSDRIGNPYEYGGCWNPDDTGIGTDCSGLVVSICDAVRNGTAMAWSRHGMTTESWRPIDVGQTGTIFNTICVASPADFPPDAAVKIALHHGPGGGVNSHMWCEVDGMRGESNGSDGCVTGSQAMSVYDTAYANDWHYIPGPIGGGPVPAQPKVLTRDEYARAIIAEGRRRGVTERGIKIALATALVESDLKMYANAGDPESLNFPHEALSTDANSVGLFQQRAPWWGTVADRMDPARSAGLFYAALTKLDYNGPNSPGWYAQAVQKSAYPDRYDEHYGDAEDLFNRLAATPAPVPTPVPTPTSGGFMAALSDAEQRALYDEIMSRRNSRSPLRHVGEGAVGDIGDIAFNTDGSVHVLLVQTLARLGDPDSLNLLNEVAALDTTRFPDRVHDRQLAKAILNDIANRRTVESAPPTGATPGIVFTAPVAPPPPAALPAILNPLSTEGGLFGDIISLSNKLQTVSQQVTNIMEGK